MNLIEILITGKNLAKPAIEGAKADSEGLGSTLNKVSAVAAVALVGMAADAVHMATEYESVTTRLVTSAGEQQSSLDMVRKGMLDMAGQVGVSAIDLAKAMYYVESAGYHGAEGLTVLKAAAQGAAAEGADTTTVAKALTDVLVDYHLKASDAATVTSQMITAVANGKTSLQEFSGAFASIVPAASAAGISFPDVASALAEMTNHGFTAARASQNLAQALRSLLNPTGPMKKAFGEFGVSSDELKAKLAGPNGLTDAMQYLSEKATKAGKEGTPAFAAALKLLMGTAPGANAALATTGENFAATSQAIDKVSKSTKDGQGNVKGFAEMQQTLGQKTKELQASFDSLMIELGNDLLPVLKNVADFMLNHKTAVEVLIGALLALAAISGTVATVMKAAGVAQGVWTAATKVAEGVMWLFNDACIGTRIGLAALAVQEGVMAVASKAWAAAQWLVNAAMDASPIILIIAAVAALGFGIFELVKHWKTVWADIKKWAEDAWKFIWDGFGKWLLPLLGPVGMVALGVIELAKHWRQLWGDIKQVGLDFGRWLWDDFGVKVMHFFTETIPRWFDTAVRDVKGAWQAVYDAIIAPVVHVYNDAMSLLTKLGNFIESLPGKAASAAAKVGSSILHAGGNWNPLNWAHGGVVSFKALGGPQGGLAVVGEQGPELVQLPQGSTVMPNANLSSMLAGGGGYGGQNALTLQLEWVGGGDDPLFQLLRRGIRVRGGNVQKVLGVGA